MTNREAELLELIRKNPAISQIELADTLSITRSSVAVHITNLTKKGYIPGKGYILKGVPVVGFGTDELPAFYTAKSGYHVELV